MSDETRPEAAGRRPDPTALSDTYPQPVRWIGRWPWTAWTPWHRTSVVGHLAGRLLLGVTGLVSALVLVLSLGPQAWHAVFWREPEYELLASLHAGNSYTYVVGLLGEPAFVKNAVVGTELVQHIFVRRDHLVTAVTRGDEIVVLSVLSCDAEFAPEFVTPIGSVVHLQSRPAAQADVARAGFMEPDADPVLSLAPPVTVSSLDQLVVEGGAVSNASRGRAYYYGINSACADLSEFGLGLEGWFGPRTQAPAAVAGALAHSGANFYAETVDLEVRLGENAQAEFLQDDGSWVGGLCLSPFHFDLPIGVVRHAGTRHF